MEAMRTALTALLLTGLGMSAHATIFWDDEMEQGNTDFSAAYMLSTLIPGLNMAYDTNVKFSGNGSIRLNYPSNCFAGSGSGAQCGGSIGRSHTPSESVWTRVYFRMSGSGPNPSASGKFETSLGSFTKMFRGKTDSTSSSPSSYWWTMGCCGSKNFMVTMEGVPSAGHATNAFSSITLADNRWYCIETHAELNTPGVANGISEAWVDGVKVLTKTDVMWRPTGSSIQWNNFNIVRQEGNGNTWYDRFAAGNTRIGCLGSTPDTQAPTVPANLRAQAVSSSQINLTWTASTDNVGVTGYRIYRSSTQIATATGTTYSSTGLSASTAYSYTVSAYDAAGKASGQSTAASTTTHAAATGAVGTVSNLSAAASGANSVTLSFTEVTDGAGQPAKYDVRFSSSGALWGGAPSVTQGTCATPLAGTTIGATKICTVLGLLPSKAYQFQLIAFRGTMGAGEVYGALSNLAGASTSSAANVMPPAKPQNMRVQQ